MGLPGAPRDISKTSGVAVTPLEAVSAALGPLGRVRRKPGAPMASRGSWETVSYTHLRAHETGAYL
eukprot:7581747-Pyramimonas_sp.AAC.1